MPGSNYSSDILQNQRRAQAGQQAAKATDNGRTNEASPSDSGKMTGNRITQYIGNLNDRDTQPNRSPDPRTPNSKF